MVARGLEKKASLSKTQMIFVFKAEKLYDAVMVDTWHYAFIKPIELYRAKKNLSCVNFKKSFKRLETPRIEWRWQENLTVLEMDEVTSLKGLGQ